MKYLMKLKFFTESKKNIKIFEELKENTDIIEMICLQNYNDYIILNRDELYQLQKEGFNLVWNEEIEDVGEGWMFDKDESDKIRQWLEIYRITKNPDETNTIIKFNV